MASFVLPYNRILNSKLLGNPVGNSFPNGKRFSDQSNRHCIRTFIKNRKEREKWSTSIASPSFPEISDWKYTYHIFFQPEFPFLPSLVSIGAEIEHL